MYTAPTIKSRHFLLYGKDPMILQRELQLSEKQALDYSIELIDYSII